MALKHKFEYLNDLFNLKFDWLHHRPVKDIGVREPDGEGNNTRNPLWGSVDTAFGRVTKNSYADGKGQMQDGPNARQISDEIMAQPKDVNGNDRDIPNAAGINEFHQFFGQFLTHDMAESKGAPAPNPNGPPPVDPPLIVEGLPFPFTRTPFVADTKGVRQQLNDETSFLDLSQVYGHNGQMLKLLRAESGASAKLLMSGDAQNLLPTFQQVADNAGLQVADVAPILFGNFAAAFSPSHFATGDNRSNQQGALLTHHMMWAREHNLQVEKLAAKYPSWDQNKLFEAARAITEAEWQHIVYEEYLPKLIGESAIKDYKGYKANVNPAVINEFTTVAFRFGHDQSSNSFSNLGELGEVINTFTLARSFQLANAAQAVRSSGEMDEWVRGQLAHATQEIDGKIVDGNRNLLFSLPGGTILDLNVFDIMRGRDHGVGIYNVLREGIGFRKYKSFEEFARTNKLDADTLDALKDVYGNNIDKLDSLVGGLLEKNHKDSQLGETFTKLTAMQFANLRDGDRLYYENRFKGQPEVLNMIEDTTLADVIQRTTGIDHVYHDGFAAHKRIGGTNGSETLNGTNGKDLLKALDGNDLVYAGKGDDDIYGGNGYDTLHGQDGNDRSYGGEGNDYIYAGRGKDILNGGGGNDYLDAGKDSDKDIFVFDAYLSANNVDTLKNFDVKRDEIHLDRDVFTALKGSDLDKNEFHVAKGDALAADKHDKIIYQSKTGDLYYDADGKGGNDAILIADLDVNLKLSHQNFEIV